MAIDDITTSASTSTEHRAQSNASSMLAQLVATDYLRQLLCRTDTA